MLRAAIKKFAHYEKHWTYTRFNISYAKKLAFTQFLNTAIIPYIVNIHFNVASLSLKAQQKMDIAGGLIEDIHIIILLRKTQKNRQEKTFYFILKIFLI